MKKIVLILLGLVAMTQSSFAQFAVSDAPNLAQNVKNFAELRKQFGVLKEQKDRLDMTLDLMRKVNSKVEQSMLVKSIIERQSTLTQQCIDVFNNKDLSSNTLQTLTSSVGVILNNNKRLISLSKSILSTDLKMNDSERLVMLQKIEERTIAEERKVSKVTQVINEYNRLKRMFR